MSVTAHLGVDEKAIEQPEAFRERVMIRADRAGEEEQRRIAVARTQIAEDLVVRAVLLDDVDHVRERRISNRGRRSLRVPRVGATHACGESLELRAARTRRKRHRDRPVDLAERVVRAPHLRGHDLERLRILRVRRGAAPLPIQRPERVAARDDGCRIPPRWNATHKAVVARRRGPIRRRRRQLEHRDRIGVRLGDVESHPVGRQRNRVRRAPLARSARWRVRQRGDDATPLGVDHGDAIRAARRGEQT